MGAFSIWHIVVIAVVAGFLFFGWKQLPDMSRSLGRSLRVFKTEIKGLTEDDDARDRAREQAAAEPRQLGSRPAPASRQAPYADVVRKTPAPAAAPKAPPAPAATRPRPTPSPNGRAGNG